MDHLNGAVLPLDGAWDFVFDGKSGQIQVPGCWEAQGYSKIVDGPAFYRRRVPIPAGWAAGQVWIEFGAVSYACQVWINGKLAGEHAGLWTPFAFNISAFIQPAQENLVEVQVYKPGARYPMRSSLAGFLPDVATTFGGIWQPVRLRWAAVDLQEVAVTPDPASGQVRLTAAAVGIPPGQEGASWEISLTHGGEVAAQAVLPLRSTRRLDAELRVPAPALWSPQSPALYQARIRLVSGGEAAAEVSQRFGFRTIEARQGMVVVNGQPALLRGVLSWGWQPDRIAPAYTPAAARDEIRRVKAMGFNLVKLCLFVPDPVYFDIADEEGVFLWEELPLWLPEVTPELRRQAPLEYADIVRVVRHHPAVIMYSLGCELNRSVDASLIGDLDHAVRGQVRGALVCDNSGSGESYGGLDFDLADFTDYHPYYDLHYFEPLLDNWRRDWQPPRPWIFGEFNDADGFRDLAEIDAANGGARPWWLTADNPVTTWRPEALALVEHDARLARSTPAHAPAELVRIAAAQSLMVRKYTLETLRKRGGMGGYVITGLRDTPIATSGVFDDLGRPKWPPEAMRPFNSDAILCLDTGRRRRWTNGGDRPDPLDLHCFTAGSEAHWHIILSAFGLAPAKGTLRWSLAALDGAAVLSGEAPFAGLGQAGAPREIAALSCPLPDVERACELRLEASLESGQDAIHNEWPVWVFPRAPRRAAPAGIGVYDPTGCLRGLVQPYREVQPLEPVWRWRAPLVIATAWCSSLEDYLQRGGRVLLLQQGDGPLPSRRGPFWREAVKLFEPHPLWDDFPHQGYVGMQFFGLAGDVLLDTASFPERVPGLSGLRPILRRLDARDFSVTDYLVEMKLWTGRLLACSLHLQGGAGAQPAAPARAVAGTALLAALITYLTEENHG